MINNYIYMWSFAEAPQQYKNLSTHGGDEDWVVYIPNNVSYPPLGMIMMMFILVV